MSYGNTQNYDMMDRDVVPNGNGVPHGVRGQQDWQERGNDMYVVCKEHVELAIDKFVDEFEDAPDVVDLDEVEFSDWERPIKCCMDCEHEAKFLIV